jgi:hypothetical protein
MVVESTLWVLASAFGFVALLSAFSLPLASCNQKWVFRFLGNIEIVNLEMKADVCNPTACSS